MASLQKHRVGSNTYWRIVESRRVNGKPRPVPVAYLGTADALLARLQDPGRTPGPLRVSSKQHGDVAALKAMADRLGLADMVDRHVPGGRRSPSVGTQPCYLQRSTGLYGPDPSEPGRSGRVRPPSRICLV